MNVRLTVTAAAATIVASIALHPLIGSGGWFWEGVGAVLVVAGTASLTRLRRLPVLACLLLTASGLLLYLNLVFSHAHSFGGVLPTPASLAGLQQLNDTGWAEAARYAPPVPGLRAVTFLAVSGIGIAAIFTDLLAVRLRQAAAAGVPLLTLFSATVASKASASSAEEALIFGAGVAGYLALLVADGRDRIHAWGRLVPVYPAGRRGPAPHAPPKAAEGPNTQALAAAGRRVGVAAVAAAIVLPLLVPGLKVRDLFGGGPGAGTRAGRAVVTLPDPLDELDHQLRLPRPRTVLTYHSDSPDPPYLRVYSLELAPNTAVWTLRVQGSRVAHGGQLPPAPGLQGASYRVTHTVVRIARGVTGSVTKGTRTENFLPLPYPAVNVRLGRDWLVDPGSLMVWSANSIGALSYTATSKDVQPTPAELRSAPPPAPFPAAGGQDATVPPAYYSLSALARQITQSAVTPYDKAVKLQQFFTVTGGFTYSLNASEPPTAAGLKDFLLHSKRGFCQQFAFAFAVLARLVGIPARVAVGYTAGTYQSDGSWRVVTTDAHAWPELYFQGAGWLPWEPTPAGSAAGQATAKPPAYTLPSAGGAGQNSALGLPGGVAGGAGGAQLGGSAGPGAKRFLESQNAAGAGSRHRGQPWLWWLTALVALGLAVLVTPLVARRLTLLRNMVIIRRGTHAAPAAAWLEIRDQLEDFGIGCRPSESPRAAAARVSSRAGIAPEACEALHRIALAEERAQFAAHPGGVPRLAADVVTVRRAVAASVNWHERWRAWAFPASKAAQMRAVARHALDVFGWAEVATSWLSARVRSVGRPNVDQASVS